MSVVTSNFRTIAILTNSSCAHCASVARVLELRVAWMLHNEAFPNKRLETWSTHDKVNVFQNIAGPVPPKCGSYPIRGRRPFVAYLNSPYSTMWVFGRGCLRKRKWVGRVTRLTRQQNSVFRPGSWRRRTNACSYVTIRRSPWSLSGWMPDAPLLPLYQRCQVDRTLE